MDRNEKERTDPRGSWKRGPQLRENAQTLRGPKVGRGLDGNRPWSISMFDISKSNRLQAGSLLSCRKFGADCRWDEKLDIRTGMVDDSVD